jgi:hypothetical protein
MQRLKALDVQMLATPDQQISLTGPDDDLAVEHATTLRHAGNLDCFDLTDRLLNDRLPLVVRIGPVV